MFGMNRPHQIVEQHDDDSSDEDDVAVYVSPRRFVGRTPGPKATKQRIFDEAQQNQHAQTQGPSDSDPDADADDDADVTPRKPSSNASHRSNNIHNKSISLGIENVKYVVTDANYSKFNNKKKTPRSPVLVYFNNTLKYTQTHSTTNQPI